MSEGDVDTVPDVREPVGDVVALFDLLGPEFGDPLLLHAARAAATDNAAIASTTSRILYTNHLVDEG